MARTTFGLPDTLALRPVAQNAWSDVAKFCDHPNMSMADLEIYRATTADWRAVRDIRLRALTDAPEAFGSTYAREVAFTEDDWTRRLASEDSATFLGRLGGRPVGIIGGWRDGAGIELVSMWVDPAARGKGVAKPLIDAVVTWGAAIGEKRVHLWVTAGNDAAYTLYERCGFVDTGERQPLPSNPDLTEIGMERTLP
ncbi:MAG TPA: GNAT family N-acetyltransferase [Jiangellaceae bacterium]